MGTLAVPNTFSAGTTIVAAEMNANFDGIESFVNTSPGVIHKDLIDAKGDLLAGQADNTVVIVTVGANGTILAADSSASAGVAWASYATDNNIIANQVFS